MRRTRYTTPFAVRVREAARGRHLVSRLELAEALYPDPDSWLHAMHGGPAGCIRTLTRELRRRGAKVYRSDNHPDHWLVDLPWHLVDQPICATCADDCEVLTPCVTCGAVLCAKCHRDDAVQCEVCIESERMMPV